MASGKKTSVAAIVFIAVGVIFFVTIILLAAFLPDDNVKQEADYGMRFNSLDVTVDWNDDRSCHIKQDISALFYVSSHGIYVDIPVNSGEKVRNISVDTDPYRGYSVMREGGGKIIRLKIGDEGKTFYSGATFDCEIEYDLITPVHPTDGDLLAINAIGGGWTCPTTDASVTVNYPEAPDNYAEAGIWIGGEKLSASSERAAVQWSNEGKTLFIKVNKRRGDLDISDIYASKYTSPASPAALMPFEGVEVVYKMPSGVLNERTDNEWIAVVVAGAALLLVAIALKFAVKNKPVTPIVDFYPPYVDCADGVKRRMLPVQMGKVIDGSCSQTDLTSFIFYWASKGFINIDERDGDTYFIRLNDVEAVTPYERKLFDSLFTGGTVNADGRKEVAMSSLKGKFASKLQTAKAGVDAEYRGKLYRGPSIALCACMFVLAAVFAFCAASVTSLRAGFISPLYGAVSIVCTIFSVALGALLVLYMLKLSRKVRILSVSAYVLMCFAFSSVIAVLVPADVLSVVEKVVFALCFGGVTALAPFYCLRTDYYTEQLNSIIGFRNFLRDAEKSRLELLIKDDPQYFYDILPYANVLGVSKVWEDKFADIAMDPPTYYHSTTGDLFRLYMIGNLLNSVGRTLTYVPPSNKGSFSGGRGGGGFSGGSFGGGGGGRW